MTSSVPHDSRPLYAVEAIGQFGDSEFFRGLRKVGDDKDIGAPYALSIDLTTEAALHRSVAGHFARLRSMKVADPPPELIGVIVGGGHPAQLSVVGTQGELRFLREINTTILYVEVGGNTGSNRQEPSAHESVVMYSPQSIQTAQRRRWWQFWRRG